MGTGGWVDCDRVFRGCEELLQPDEFVIAAKARMMAGPDRVPFPCTLSP